tara:strand:+ start:686 stop:934 length:249 start_codon:yes stop_codon:yes gene_type:complete
MSEEPAAVEFSGLILGFSSAALSYMGVQHEGGIQVPKNLQLAKQNIDIIKMLKDKTKGNLDKQEEDLLSQVLQDLSQRYSDA